MTAAATVGTRSGVLGPYHLERRLSADFIGSLWSAKVQGLPRIGSQATVRRIEERPPFSRGAIDDAEEGARWAAELDPRVFLPVIDLVRDERQLGVVFPPLCGSTLRGILRNASRRMRPLPEGVVTRIALDVADQCARLVQIDSGYQWHLFGAITPESVFVDKSGRARLMDLGASAAMARHALLVRHAEGAMYFAPEQLGGSSSPRTDVFALGLLVWQMLSARCPRHASTFDELSERIRFRAVPNLCNLVRPRTPPVARALGDIVARAVHPSPDRRFSNATEFVEALASVAEPVMHIEAAVILGIVRSSGVHRMSLPDLTHELTRAEPSAGRRHRGPLDTIPYEAEHSSAAEQSAPGDYDERETLPRFEGDSDDDDVAWDML